MKRVISFAIFSAMLICAFLAALPTMAATPEGTAVGSASDFAAMSEGGKYYLSKDITISASYANTFKGTLDGNGHKIIIKEGKNISPFSQIAGATFKNLTVEGVINVTSRTTYGGIAPLGYGTFENVTVKVGISAMVENSFNSVGVSQGCFIGRATGACSFINCKNEASVTVITQKGSATVESTTGFGGFIGTATGSSISFVNCSNNATMTSLEPHINIGGFIGISVNADLSFDSCDNNAFIIGAGSTEQHCGTGGFVGTVNGGSIAVKNCKNVADVQNTGALGHTGGCVGRLLNVLNLEIDGFENMRAVYNTVNHWEGVGGVVGFMSDVPAGSSGRYIFKDCVNSGWVSGSMAGGIVGIDDACNGIDMRFERCVNVTLVKTLGLAYAGGILGRTNGSLRGLSFIKCLNTGEITTADGAYGVGGIVGNIGADNITYNYTPVFEYCVNTGTIACKTDISTAGNVVAAGILARNIFMPVTIRNCVNMGTLTNSCTSSNLAPIAPKYNSINHSVSGCSYLSGSGGSAVWGESARSIGDIRYDVVSALTNGLRPEAEYCNYRNSDSAINSVGEGVDAVKAATTVAEVSAGAVPIISKTRLLVLLSTEREQKLALLGTPISNTDGEYTTASYTEYITAFDKIKSDINAATDLAALEAIDVPALKGAAEAKLVSALDAKRSELLVLLGEKIYNDDGLYTLDSYEDYSDAYLAIKAIIDNAKDVSTLDVIDVPTLKDAVESKLVLDTPSNPTPPQLDGESDSVGEENENGKQDSPEKTEEKTDENKETEEPPKKKCGSSVTLSALAFACILGIGFVVKKKD